MGYYSIGLPFYKTFYAVERAAAGDKCPEMTYNGNVDK